jgi:hypothetical protein
VRGELFCVGEEVGGAGVERLGDLGAAAREGAGVLGWPRALPEPGRGT